MSDNQAAPNDTAETLAARIYSLIGGYKAAHEDPALDYESLGLYGVAYREVIDDLERALAAAVPASPATNTDEWETFRAEDGHLSLRLAADTTNPTTPTNVRALRFAQAQAVTMRARGRLATERDWLDMCALLEGGE